MKRNPAWPYLPLTDLVDVLDGRRIPVSAKERSKRTGDVPYFGATGQVGWIDNALFDEDLVLLGEDGVQFFDPFKSKAYAISGPSWVNNHAHVLRSRAGLDRKFLLYFLNAFDYRGFANGTTRLKLTQAAMRRMLIACPSLDEQRRIVDILEDHLSRLDSACLSLESAERRGKALRSSLLRRLWDDALALGRLVPVSDLGSVVTGATPRGGTVATGCDLLPFITPGDVAWDGSEVTHCERSVSRGLVAGSRELPPGAVLFVSIGATIGKVGWTARLATTNQQINSVRLGDSLRAEFAALLMSSRNFQDQVGAESSSTTMPILNKSKFSALKIPLPNVDCTHLLGPVRQYLDGISIMQQNVDAASRRTAMLRHSLLHAAFSGRLTGRSSDLDLAEELAAQ